MCSRLTIAGSFSALTHGLRRSPLLLHRVAIQLAACIRHLHNDKGEAVSETVQTHNTGKQVRESTRAIRQGAIDTPVPKLMAARSDVGVGDHGRPSKPTRIVSFGFWPASEPPGTGESGRRRRSGVGQGQLMS
jgi:hypothetical protein